LIGVQGSERQEEDVKIFQEVETERLMGGLERREGQNQLLDGPSVQRISSRWV